MPVLTVSENTWPQVGFSRNRWIRPSSSTMTMPNSSGFGHPGQRHGDQRAVVLVEADQVGQVDVGERVAGDDQERLVPQRVLGVLARCPRCRAASPRWRTAGSSRAPRRRRSSCAPGRRGTARSPRSRSKPCRLSSRSTCSMIGRLTTGSSGLGWFAVIGRSRVPSPPAITTAFNGFAAPSRFPPLCAPRHGRNQGRALLPNELAVSLTRLLTWTRYSTAAHQYRAVPQIANAQPTDPGERPAPAGVIAKEQQAGRRTAGKAWRPCRRS